MGRRNNHIVETHATSLEKELKRSTGAYPILAASAIRGLFYLSTILCVFGGGVYVGVFKPSGYLPLRELYTHLRSRLPPPIDPKYTTILSHWTGTDVAREIEINAAADVLKKRDDLIHFIWKGTGFPQRSRPDGIIDNIKDVRYAGWSNLKEIKEYVIVEEHGVNSIAYHFFSSKPKNHLVIVHSGHDAEFEDDAIQLFLDNGYDVLAFSMPLMGMNSQPYIDIPRFGRIRLTNHDKLRLLDTDDFSSIKYFLEPIAISLNHIQKSFAYTSINMVGVSGGGWTTVLYAALDPRVRHSYPVAAGYPQFLRDDSRSEAGDYEQSAGPMYRIVTYLELYIMGAFGENRRQVQIVNLYDSCCSWGIRYSLYEREVKTRVKDLKMGEYDIFVDRSRYDHTITPNTLSYILHDIESQ